MFEFEKNNNVKNIKKYHVENFRMYSAIAKHDYYKGKIDEYNKNNMDKKVN